MGRGIKLLFMVAIIGLSLAMGAGERDRASMVERAEGTEPGRRAPVEALSIRRFEQSGFLTRYPPVATRRTWHGGALLHGYLFEDQENPRSRVLVELGPDPEHVHLLTIVWHGEALYKPASWSGIKSHFLADLVEAVFPDVDYGELSAYVWQQQGKSYPEGAGAMPKQVLQQVRVFAGASGPSLVIGIERYPRPQP